MNDEIREITLNAPTGAAPGVGLWIAALANARQRTLELLERVTPAMVDAQAPYHEHTIGTLLYHIAIIEADWLCIEIEEHEEYPAEIVALFPWDHRDEQRRLTTVTGLTLEAHLARLAQVRAALTETLLALSDAEFRQARTLPDAVVSTVWVVHHLLQHEAEHRGEMGQLLDVLETVEAGE